MKLLLISILLGISGLALGQSYDVYPHVRLLLPTSSLEDERSPKLVSNGADKIVAIWSLDHPQSGRLRIAFSENEGSSWQQTGIYESEVSVISEGNCTLEPQLLFTKVGASDYFLVIAAASFERKGEVYSGIIGLRSAGGSLWPSNWTLLHELNDLEQVREVQVASTQDGLLYITWTTGSSVRLIHSSDAGASWSNPIVIEDSLGAYQIKHCSVAAASGLIRISTINDNPQRFEYGHYSVGLSVYRAPISTTGELGEIDLELHTPVYPHWAENDCGRGKIAHPSMVTTPQGHSIVVWETLRDLDHPQSPAGPYEVIELLHVTPDSLWQVVRIDEVPFASGLSTGQPRVFCNADGFVGVYWARTSFSHITGWLPTNGCYLQELQLLQSGGIVLGDRYKIGPFVPNTYNNYDIEPYFATQYGVLGPGSPNAYGIIKTNHPANSYGTDDLFLIRMTMP